MILILLTALSCSTANQPTAERATQQPSAMLQSTWPHANTLSDMRQVVHVPGIAWQELTDAYLQSIAERRTAAQAWTKTHPVNVVFVGQEHLAEGSDPRQLIASQTKTLDAITTVNYSGGGVITLELSGTDLPLTWDTYLSSQIAAAAKYDGFVIDRALAESQLLQNAALDSDISLVRGASALPPIICGEEAPLHRTHQAMLGVAGSMSVTNDFVMTMGIVRYMRTEMTLVRGIEYLASHGGNTIVISEGFLHADDLARIEGYTMTLTMVDTTSH